MIYIKNVKETQTIFIPRNELEKEAFVTSIKSYEDGLEEGLTLGKEQQKDELLNLYVTENGVYEREDGWGRVEVVFEPKLQDKDITMSEANATVTCDEGYEGLGEVKVDATEYGHKQYENGHTDGYTKGKDIGFIDGYSEGKEDGYEEGKEDGYEDGFEKGKEEGYTDGYNQGLSECPECPDCPDCPEGEGDEFASADNFKNLVEADGFFQYFEVYGNGTYMAPINYNGQTNKAEGAWWRTSQMPSIDTEIEIWVKPLEESPYDAWLGYVGCQNSDDDNTTIQIRRQDYSPMFSFRFGNATAEYEFNVGQWYFIRMNREGVWINGLQVAWFDAWEFEQGSNSFMINAINNQAWEGSYRNNIAEYGYVKINGVTYYPMADGSFKTKEGEVVEYEGNEPNVTSQYSSGSLGYQSVGVRVEGGSCDEAWQNGYDTGYSDGQASCGGSEVSCNLVPLVVTENGTYEPEKAYMPMIKGNNSAYNSGVYLEEDSWIEMWFSAGDAYELPTLFGTEASDYDATGFSLRMYEGRIGIRIGNFMYDYDFNSFRNDGKAHKVKLGKYVGFWVDDECIMENFIDYIDPNWQIVDAPLYLGAMCNLLDGDENHIWRPWDNGISNATIYGVRNGEKREWHFDVADNTYVLRETDEVLTDLNGNATYQGELPLATSIDGYSSVSVEVPSFDEGRNDVLSKMEAIEITKNGQYSIYTQEYKTGLVFGGRMSHYNTEIYATNKIKIEVCVRPRDGEFSGGCIVGGGGFYGVEIADSDRGIGIFMKDNTVYGLWGPNQTHSVGCEEGKDTIVTLDIDGGSFGGWLKNSFDFRSDYPLYIGTYSSTGAFEDSFIGIIRWLKIWTNKDDDSTMIMYTPSTKNGEGVFEKSGAETGVIESRKDVGDYLYPAEMWSTTELSYPNGFYSVTVNMETDLDMSGKDMDSPTTYTIAQSLSNGNGRKIIFSQATTLSNTTKNLFASKGWTIIVK